MLPRSKGRLPGTTEAVLALKKQGRLEEAEALRKEVLATRGVRAPRRPQPVPVIAPVVEEKENVDPPLFGVGTHVSVCVQVDFGYGPPANFRLTTRPGNDLGVLMSAEDVTPLLRKTGLAADVARAALEREQLKAFLRSKLVEAQAAVRRYERKRREARGAGNEEDVIRYTRKVAEAREKLEDNNFLED